MHHQRHPTLFCTTLFTRPTREGRARSVYGALLKLCAAAGVPQRAVEVWETALQVRSSLPGPSTAWSSAGCLLQSVCSLRRSWGSGAELMTISITGHWYVCECALVVVAPHCKSKSTHQSMPSPTPWYLKDRQITVSSMQSVRMHGRAL